MKRTTIALLLFGLFSSTGFGATAVKEGSEFFDACGENERVRFADVVPSEEQNQANEVVGGIRTGPDVYKVGAHLLKTAKHPDTIEVAKFLKARAYYHEKLIHVAYEQFRLLLLENPSEKPLLGRMAALQCILKMQQEYPTLSFDVDSGKALAQYMSRPDLQKGDREAIARGLVLRMREIVNRWDPAEAKMVTDALNFKSTQGYLNYAQALQAQRFGQFNIAIPLLEKLVDKEELPSNFKQDRDSLILMYARDLYEIGKYEKSADVLRKIPRDSNYLAQALSDLTWALLMAGKKQEAIGTAFNLQKSLLTRVYAPEAPLVASIALHEMCQYSRALKNAVFFKKKYYPVLLWYKRLTQSQKERPYQTLVAALRRKQSIPNVVLLEWLRSPEYRALQLEANLYFDEKKNAYKSYAQRVSAEKGATWVKEYKAPLPKFYNGVDTQHRRVARYMDQVLAAVNARMVKQLVRLVENVQLLEIEIYDNAGEDMIWRNVNPEYPIWLSKLPEESRRKDLYWEWGSMPTDPKIRDEVWEDELGWTLGNVTDECSTKKKYREERFSKNPPPSEPEPAPAAAQPNGG